MRLLTCHAAMCRALATLLTVTLCVGLAPERVRAQDGGLPIIASGGETVLLRESPGWDAAVLTDLPDGSALEVTGEATTAADGALWVPVVSGGQSGYVPAGYVAAAPLAEPVAEIATDAPAPEWTPDATADPMLAAAPAAEPAYVEPAPVSGGAVTTADANLRTWPGTEAEVLQVLPPGSPVSVTGPVENGFVPVQGNGAAGWLAADLVAEGTGTALPPPLLATDAAIAPEPVTTTADAISTTPAETEGTAPAASIAPPPDLSSGGSTGIIWPFAGGEWEVVQGYNNGTHTNRGGFAQYKYSLDWARTDGNTAGQPVYAPVSGTIEWTDRGSGGMLINAGNGYGVAVFHVTIDRGIARGGSVERGQQIGVVSGPGGDGYMSMAHVDITCWRLDGRNHEAVPFSGPNAIAGQEFPDTGGGNQHMGAKVSV